MTNELSTMLYRINFRYILDHFLDQALWKKSWRIYEYDGCILEMRLSEISITDDKLRLTIKRPQSYGSHSLSLPLAKEHFNETVFYKMLFSNMLDALHGAEYWDITKTAAYEAASQTEDDVHDANKQKAEDYLDSLDIEDRAIRKAYIDAYVDENSVSLTSKVILQLRYLIHSSRYLMLAYQFENLAPEQSKNLIETVRNKCLGDGVEDQIQEITEALKLFNFEEMSNLDDAIQHLKESKENET